MHDSGGRAAERADGFSFGRIVGNAVGLMAGGLKTTMSCVRSIALLEVEFADRTTSYNSL